jgi:hypothetical protein
MSRSSAVGIATGYGLDVDDSEFESRWGQEFSLLHIVNTGFEVHQNFYPMCIGGPFPGRKAAGVWKWPLTSNYSRGKANADLYIDSKYVFMN